MRNATLKNQFAGEEQLPRYGYHVRDTVVSLEDGRLAVAVRCKGLPFEVISGNLLENQYDSLNDMLMNLAKSTGARLAVWAILDHYQTRFTGNYEFSHQWMRDFHGKYMDHFLASDVVENSFYLCFVLKPADNDVLEDSIREMEEIEQTVLQMLHAYECDVLGVYDRNGHPYSTFYEFIAYLYNGFWEPIPVTSLPLYQSAQSSSL